VTGLILLVALRFFPTLAEGRLYGPFRDNIYSYGPMFAETARVALRGEFPYYLPGLGTGFALFQSPHYSVCYPFYFFGLLDYGGALQSLSTLTYLSVFHCLLFGLSLYSMLRCARVSPWAAFLGASIGIFARNTEIYANWLTMAATYTWMPLFIGAGILILRTPGRFWSIFLLGVSAGMITLASASQSIAHAMLFSVIFFGAGILWTYRNHGRQSVIRLVASLAAATAIAFGLAAVAAIPAYAGIEGMIRFIGGGFVLGHQHLPWAKFNEYQLAIAELPGILVKPAWISIVGSPYVGPLGVAGSAFALIFFRRLDSMERFLVAVIGSIGLYALLSACGTNLGFAYLNYHLPLINQLREAGRHLVLFVIVIVFLAGFGFDQVGKLLAEGGAIRQLRWRAGLPICAAVLVAIGAVSWELARNSLLEHSEWFVLWLAPAVALLGFLYRIRTTPVFAMAALCASVASAISPPCTFDLANSGYVASENLRSLEVLAAVREKIEPGNFRFDFEDTKFSVFSWGMNASHFGLASFYLNLETQPYDQFRFSQLRRIPYLRAMMGTRYVLCSAEKTPTDPGAELRFEVQGHKLFENPAYMGRLTFVHTLAGKINDESEFIKEVGRGFDFLGKAYIQEKDASRLVPFLSMASTEKPAISDRLDVLRNSVNRVEVSVESSQPGVLILNEWFIPAWRATVNGDSKPILRVNQWQVGVPLHPGRNLVEFNYRPPAFWALLILNRVTWLLLGVLVLMHLVRLALTKTTTVP
jgi:hypothetical protein